MRREIKVRAWDGEKFYSPILHNGLVFRNGRDLEDYVPTQDPIIQYTGAKDKNGVEIYDGYCVLVKEVYDRGDGDRDDDIGYIKFCDEYAAFIVKMVRTNDWFFINDLELEVIGNICENPELLND